jgi:hypothetical protein
VTALFNRALIGGLLLSWAQLPAVTAASSFSLTAATIAASSPVTAFPRTVAIWASV